jgi:hypothetical protein
VNPITIKIIVLKASTQKAETATPAKNILTGLMPFFHAKIYIQKAAAIALKRL